MDTTVFSFCLHTIEMWNGRRRTRRTRQRYTITTTPFHRSYLRSRPRSYGYMHLRRLCERQTPALKWNTMETPLLVEWDDDCHPFVSLFISFPFNPFPCLPSFLKTIPLLSPLRYFTSSYLTFPRHLIWGFRFRN